MKYNQPNAYLALLVYAIHLPAKASSFLANFSCKPPAAVEPILYSLANESGWKPQQNPEKEAEDAINLAGWLCWKQKNEKNSQLEGLAAEAINNASPDIKRRAEVILKMCPDLVPIVDGTWLRWPEETNRNWRQIFGCKPPPPQNWGVYVGFLPHKQFEFDHNDD